VERKSNKLSILVCIYIIYRHETGTSSLLEVFFIEVEAFYIVDSNGWQAY